MTTNHTPLKIWITPEYFIQVDDDGYVSGVCYEGALGFIIPVRSCLTHKLLALKIPRLLADSVRENTYITQIVDGESRVVHSLHETRGLLRSSEVGHDSLRSRMQLENSVDAAAREQNQGILLFAFKKERNPRVCIVRLDKLPEDGAPPRMFVYPPGCRSDVERLSIESISEATTRAVEHGLRATPFCVEVLSNDERMKIPRGYTPLARTLTSSPPRPVWYGAIPSMLFDWASGTLQEAIAQGAFVNWDISQHFSMGVGILQGLDTLHAQEVVHGDIRPANIMIQGQHGDPNSFLVGDYGSFSREFLPRGTTSEAASGHTQVGGLGRHRASVFYSPERRMGTERETADVAILLSMPPKGGEAAYLVCVGWRSDLIDPKTIRPRESVIEALREEWKRILGDKAATGSVVDSDDRLSLGDRIRIREFVFSIIGSGEIEVSNSTDEKDSRNRTLRVLLCDRRVGTVLHERMIVYDRDTSSTLRDVTVIGLPNFVEMRQWSAATDIYGAGVVLLYSMFLTRRITSGVGGKGEKYLTSSDVLASAEDDFRQLLESLESLQIFRSIWLRLDELVWNLEQDPNPNLEPTSLALRICVTRSESTNEDFAGFGNKSIIEAATDVTNDFCRSVPHLKGMILPYFRGTPSQHGERYNLAHFLFFMHFVLSCIHRQSHLRSLSAHESPYPFCKTRRTPPLPEGAALSARRRLAQLGRFLTQSRFLGLQVASADIQEKDERGELEIQRDNRSLKDRLSALEKELSDARSELQACQTRLRTVESERAAEHSRANRLSKESASMESQVKNLEERYRTSEARLLRAESDLLVSKDSLQAAQMKVNEMTERALALTTGNDALRKDVAIRTAELRERDARIEMLAQMLARTKDGVASDVSQQFEQMREEGISISRIVERAERRFFRRLRAAEIGEIREHLSRISRLKLS